LFKIILYCILTRRQANIKIADIIINPFIIETDLLIINNAIDRNCGIESIIAVAMIFVIIYNLNDVGNERIYSSILTSPLKTSSACEQKINVAII
jgi:hypothetical protein